MNHRLILEDPLSRWDPPRSELAAVARKGVKQTTFFRAASLVIQFVSAALLARLLGPSAFGTVAVATIFVSFAGIFNDMGIGSALVQRKRLDETTLSTAFWLNLIIGFALTGLMVALTPAVTVLFPFDGLGIVLILSSVSLTLSVSLVQRSLLQRRMLFGPVMFLDFFFGFVAAGTSLLLAFLGVGVISIPVGTVIATAISSAAAAALCPWFPKCRPSKDALRELWSFSGGVLAFNIMDYWTKNIDNLVVGRALGSFDLGLYSRAYNLMQLPVTNLNQILSTVLFPALSSLQDDRARFARGWLLCNKIGLAAGFYVAAVVGVASPYVVRVLYGSEWMPMATALTLLIAATPAYLTSSNATPIFLALGRTTMQFRLGLATTALRVTAIVGGLPFGFSGVAAGLLIAAYLNILVTTWPALRISGISLWSAVSSIRMIVLSAVVAAAAGIALRLTLDLSEIAMLFVVGGAITVVYSALMVILERESIRLIRNRK